MEKKFLATLAAASVLGMAVAGITASVGSSVKTFAEESSHVHNNSCAIHHYAQVSPTSKSSGVKEYWVCCNDPSHTISFSAPSTGVITDATHGSDFALDSDDSRYIAPYTFPEVFSTPYAYSTAVIIADGKVTSSTGSLRFKESVLSEAYELGYTHFRFHSKAEADDAVKVCGIQDNWKNYFKRYADDNDNRYWLKSFKENNAGLKVAAQNSSGGDVSTELSLSDFHLYKSSATESWGGGDMANWSGTLAANRYIAYEDGELIADNAGGNNYNGLIEIPAELMGSKNDYTKPENRAFYVKVLAQGYSNGVGTGTNTRVVVANNDNNAVGYYFSRTSGTGDTPTATSDGFICPLYGGWVSKVGLNSGAYHDGALSIGLDYTGAIAIRLNYDFNVAWAESGFTYTALPLANTADGDMRLSLANISFTGTGTPQMNIPLPKSVNHKGAKLKIFSTAKPASNFKLMDCAVKANLTTLSTYEVVDGIYTIDAGDVIFSETNLGLSIIVRFDTSETLDGDSITFQYSWID